MRDRETESKKERERRGDKKGESDCGDLNAPLTGGVLLRPVRFSKAGISTFGFRAVAPAAGSVSAGIVFPWSLIPPTDCLCPHANRISHASFPMVSRPVLAPGDGWSLAGQGGSECAPKCARSVGQAAARVAATGFHLLGSLWPVCGLSGCFVL